MSYFLTGENRVYDRNMGCWTRVKPFENFFRVRDLRRLTFARARAPGKSPIAGDYIDFSDALSTAGIISPPTRLLRYLLRPWRASSPTTRSA